MVVRGEHPGRRQVMWILALYLNIWVCAIATLLLLSASASWVALGVLACQVGPEPPLSRHHTI